MHQNVEIRDTPDKGRGVFATRNLTPADCIHNVTDFALSAISTSELSRFCYHCYACSKPIQDSFNVGQWQDAELKRCTGCNVAYFCGKWCQTQSWKKYHKHECKLYAKLQPNILPEAVRAVIRLALQHKHHLLPEEAWTSMLSLSSHQEELRVVHRYTWTDLMLMAKAAAQYSLHAVDETIFLKLLCILKINAITLQTTYNDPIGMMLDPFISTMNHSCDANIAVHRPLYTNNVGWLQKKQDDCAGMIVMPIRDIAPGEELTIAYIDSEQYVSDRQRDLKDNYCFTCSCSKCIHDQKAEEELRACDSGLAVMQADWRKRTNDQLQAQRTSFCTAEIASSIVAELTDIVRSMESHRGFSPTADPYNRAVQELKLLHMAGSPVADKALILAMKQYLIIGPQIYPSPIHPTRVVAAIYALRILELLLYTYEPDHSFGIEIELQRKAIENMGLSHKSLKHWHFRICVEMKVPLLKSAAQELADCFAREDFGIGTTKFGSLSQAMLSGEGVKNMAEDEMKRVIGFRDDIWDSAKQKWTKTHWLPDSEVRSIIAKSLSMHAMPI